MSTAIITGASRGLGLALARALADRGWKLVIDARGAPELQRVATELEAITHVRALPGDVADDWHRGALIDAAGERVDLLVNNASTLGPSPQPELAGYPLDALERVYAVNVVAPLALAQLAVPLMPAGACVINITSDAAVEPYEGWGGYGSSKAALEQLTAILAAEQPQLRVYTVDPGDMRTQMHQEAFPGEDISDRPPPEESVPGLVELIESTLPSGRYRARDVLVEGRASMSTTALAFELPHALEATEPPEARGRARDAVRLMVADARADHITHAAFSELPEFLAAGDLVVVNVSETLPAAVAATRADGTAVRVHFATRAPELDDRWRVVELRSADGARPGPRARRGDDHAPRARRGPPQAAGPRRPVRVGLPSAAGASGRPGSVRVRRGPPAPPRRADPLRLRPPRLAAGGLPERVRPGPRQRRDAQRRASVHPPAHLRARHARDRGGADHPALPASPPRSATSRPSPRSTRCPNQRPAWSTPRAPAVVA